MAPMLHFCCEVFMFVALSFVLGEWNSRDYLKREHSLIRPYQGSGMNIPLWDFIGNTMVTNSYVRLTTDHQSRKGGIWNSVPCHVRNWELHVQFKVFGQGKSLYGDGLTIWYTKERMVLGDVFGSKDFFSGLSVFLDTYSNHNGPHNHAHPYVSAMINNGTLHYDHDRDGTHTQLAGCEAQFRNRNHDTYLSIRYFNNTLTVSTDIENKNAWKECFTVSGIHLPTGYYFGASAATGELADNHDIIAMKLYELDSPESKSDEDYTNIVPSADQQETPRERVDDSEVSYLSKLSGWKLFFVIIFSAILIGVFVLVGIFVYLQRQEDNRKRFY